MSTGAKTVVWIIVAIVVIGGLIWWFGKPAPSAPTAATGTPQNQAQSPTANSGNPAVSATDNSNAAIDSNLSNIDTQMKGFASDNASVNQGMNDQPVAQSQL